MVTEREIQNELAEIMKHIGKVMRMVADYSKEKEG